MFFEFAHHIGDSRSFLPDADVDAFNVGTLLVDDRIDGQRRFTGLAVTDNQPALSTTNRDHRVDGLQTSLHRLIYRLALNNPRCNTLDWHKIFGFYRTLTVNRLTQ